MLFLPPGFLLLWPLGLLSIALLSGGGYLLYEWYEDGRTSTSYLGVGLFMVAWSLVGFLPALLLRPRGKDEPRFERTETVEHLARPDGSEVHVEFYGPSTGIPIVMIHGWSTNSTVWYYAKRQLSKRFRLIVWDLPGLGKSSRPKNNDFSLEKYARDLDAVIDLAGDKPVFLLGHSIGGMIILTYCRLFAEKLPSRVAGLILTNTTYTNPVKTTVFNQVLQPLQKPLLEPLLHLTIWLWPLAWLMNILSYLNGSLFLAMELSGFSGKETRGQLNFTALQSLRHSPEVQARGTLGMFAYDATPVLKTVSVPTLVIAGNLDVTTLPEASHFMAERLPRCELVPLIPGNHMAFIERHEQFAEAVASFCGAPAQVG